MDKLSKKGFAECITVTLLMHLRESIAVCPDHSLHSALIAAGHKVFLFDNDTIIMDKLLNWGEQIRNRFVIDNMFQFKASVVLDQFSENTIDEKFIGAHTFSDILNKMLGAMRGMGNELNELRGCVLKISDTTNTLLTICQKQDQQMSSLLASVQMSACNSSPTEPIPQPLIQHLTVSNERTYKFKQLRSWPQTLKNPGSIQFSDLIFQYIAEAIDDIPKESNNAAQCQVIRAMEIAEQFHPGITKMNVPRGWHPTDEQISNWRSIANNIQNNVIGHILSNQKKGCRQRGPTGKVSGILRAWSSVQPKKVVNK